jgi:endonuclease I
MHHLFPTERNINSCRSSNDFGDVTTFTSCSAGGSGLGKVGGSNVFMVRPKYRGDVARAHFYFAVRYSLHIGATEEAALKAWHHQDVPDTEEQNRNNAIYGIQKNRNPFVDWPDAVDKIADF